MFSLLTIAVVLAEGVLATTPIKPELKCPLPTGPYVPPKCGRNEYFEVCSKPCPPQKCSSLWSKYACQEACCKPECRCKDGFLRNESGVCVSVVECLFPCGPLEHFVRDSNECQKTCANYKVTGPRSLCKPFTGCVCNKGRVRINDNATGACILPKQCPTRKCPIFEHWEDCPSICLKESCASKSPDYQCQLPAIPLPCKPRCVCNKGFLRDSNGNCILEKHCPIKKCPKNEVWRCTSMCTSDSCPRQNAASKCPIGDLSVCIPACACKDGFLRDDRGICIPRKLCPKVKRCGINEVEVKCATVSPPQTCESVYTLYKPLPHIPCKPGCDCRPGYLRNKFNICVPSECCPTVPPNRCGPFQEYKTCGTSCEPSCADLDNPYQICTDQCVKGCFCKEGYVKDEQGNCVTRDQCPLPVCNKPNEVAKECGSSCEVKTCDDYKRTDIVCPAVCVRGCFCRDGYVRNAYGICVLPKQCPSKPVCLLENEEYQPCGSSCPDNCDNYKDTSRICTANCVPACNCKAGFVRNLVDKTCVKPEQCPIKKCTGLNEALNFCASYCPVTCANRLSTGDWACATVCRVACDCIPGTLRNDSGVCVSVEDCTPPVCRQNEIFQQCGTACPLTCDNYKNPPQICTKQCVTGCFCAKGFVRDRNLRCVKPADCEPICPAGEKFNECSAHCQDTCENFDKPNRICTYQCQSGCVCEAGTVRRKDGKCVPPLECSPPPRCPNGTEVYSPCSAHCEPTCENSSPNQPCTRICKPGCKCIDGLVRRKDGKCVKVKECSQPTCPGNEVFDPCSAHCEDTCENHGPARPCTAICKPGCRCGSGLVRRKDGRCVKLKDCAINQPCSDPNAERVECAPVCRSTCAKPDPGPCILSCKLNDCVCKKGFILSKPKGKCIPVNQCPKDAPCNGDSNAVIKVNPIPCPSTCSAPNASPHCKKYAPEVGCECKPGFLKSTDDIDGKCIKPDTCPGGNPCGANGTFVWCYVNCPTNYCPINDNRGIIVCDPPRPCPSGCACKVNYRKKSSTNNQCILASDCPPVKCTRPNEVWSPCPSACLAENCEDINNQPTTCNTLILNCQPRCICKKGHFRNKNGICVPAKQCPINQPCSDPNAERVECAPVCRSTCAKPDPGPCILSCKLNDCVCKKGFILSKPKGKCIPVNQCPKDAPCNGDSNAVIKVNPIPCPSTCSAPNASPHCKKYAPEVGCECKPGFLKSTDDIDGKCIKPDTCPGGNPCGANGTFVWCYVNCPTNYCPINDNRGIIVCDPPRPCPSGCACKVNYRKKSSTNNQCILASDCPPVKCTRPNEVWSSCPSACLAENCEDINNQPTTCNTLILNCQPRCICKKGHFRNKNGICVPAKQCPINQPCSDPNAERVECAPVCRSTCAKPDPGPCILSCKLNDCVCKKGFILSKPKGKCIPVNQCPKDAPCNGDSNAVIKVNPIPCPSTCSAPNASPHCKKYAPEVGCECKPGFLKSTDDIDGKCIKPDTCPGGNPCGANGTFVWCYVNCPNNYCPINDNRGIIVCDPPRPCPSGCACKVNYRKKSSTNNQCILASDCPPVKCTRPNEVWSPCPSACLAENCEDINNQPTTCNTLILNCQPRCICKKGHFRNKKGICVPAKQCPKPIKCKANEVYNPCSINCPPQTCASIFSSYDCSKAPPCKPGCDCISEYLRNGTETDLCIPSNQCPGPTPVCGLNEHYEVNRNKPDLTCKTKDPQSQIDPCQETSGCFCDDGYVRNSTGICVLPKQCPPPQCKKNETYSKCGTACPATCQNRGDNCTKCTEQCVAGCFCNKGLVRADDGSCVAPKDCPQRTCDDPNEYFDKCFPPCPGTDGCSLLWSKFNCTGAVQCCKPRCRCRPGLYRGPSGACITAKECTNQSCSDPNAERSECAPAPGCRSTCAVPNPGPCILSCAINECVCKSGYVLSEKGGKCIPVDKCPIQKSCNGDPNAVIKSCPLPCPATCGAPNAIQCKKACVPVGCECKDGYILSQSGGQCIRPEKCQGGNPCGKNETFVSCKVNCPSNNCPVNNSPNRVICETPSPCYAGCVCKVNYRRRSVQDQRCIYASECPPVKCDKNEVWSGCPSACLNEDCANVDGPPVTCNTLLLNCQPKCICKKGFFRDYNRKCIPACECPTPVCGLNEHYEVNRNKCDLTCKTKDLQSQIGPCQETSGCFCDDGYVRNKTGICVLPKQCPKPIICPANEVLSECYNTCLRTCRTRIRGDGRVCHTACIESGCVCKPDYLRHDNGTCVPVSECSPPQCNKNETYSKCGTACPATCQNRGDNCTACTKQCVEGCFCNKGLVRLDDETCVAPKDCPPRTCDDPNEYFDNCFPPCPGTDGCSLLWSKFNCTGAVQCCKPRCRCRPGLYRGPSGACITAKECTTPACGLNEHYEVNRNKPDLTCKTKDPQSQIDPCQETSGCFCDDGYVRNSTGICVLPKQCPPPQCKKNETYSKCGTACPATCQNRGDNCTKCTEQCVAGCFCNKGLVRADDGSCVAPKDCPQRTCDDPNEYFDKCFPPCPGTDGCSLLWSKFNCTGAVQCCKPRCRCRPGLYRGPSGACITSQECISKSKTPVEPPAPK